MRGASSSRRVPAKTSVQLLEDAEALQQRAERRRGAEAVHLYEQAAGESLQCWAEAVATATATLPDAQLTRAVEAAASEQTLQLYERAVQAYGKVRTGDGRVRADAAVNAGNALASAAEAERASGGGRAGALLAQAAAAYRAALAQEEDALTWSNLADTLVAAAEVAAETAGALAAARVPGASGCAAEADPGGDLAAAAAAREAERLYGEAMGAYAAACGLSSSEAGDDLPALLHNWGVGLHSLGTHARALEAAEAALVEAGARLAEAAAFGKGDPAPLVATGEALAARAELRVSAAAAAPDAGEAERLLAEAGELYAQALGAGYRAALRLDGGCADARVGAAEAHVALGKLAAAGSVAQAAQHFAAAAAEYRAALRRPEALGALADRAAVRYNFACACVLAAGAAPAAAGGLLQEAAAVLRHLLATGGTTLGALGADTDFDSAREWLAAVVGGHPAAASVDRLPGCLTASRTAHGSIAALCASLLAP